MHTYIKKGTISNYIRLENDITTMPGYENAKGESWDDYLKGKYVELNNEQICFHETYPDASVEEVFFLIVPHEDPVDPVEPVEPERTLDEARYEMLIKIEQYDFSENVNIFYINNIPMWFDRETRISLRQRFEAEKAAGIGTTGLWYDGHHMALSIEAALALMQHLECYAAACYDTTQSHIAEVKAITDIEEVDGFDFTDGYPEILKFEV